MPDAGGIALLRRAAAAFRAGVPLDPADAAELDARIGEYEARAPDGVRLDDVLGLTPSPGCRPWWASERRRRRDDALRQAAALLRPEGSVAERAAALSREIRRYQSSSWRWEGLRDMPDRYRGTAREFVFKALRGARGRVPTGRQLRSILAGNELVEVIASEPCESLPRS